LPNAPRNPYLDDGSFDQALRATIALSFMLLLGLLRGA
jgi:hypothetical protein